MSLYVIDTNRLSLDQHGHAELNAKLDAYPLQELAIHGHQAPRIFNRADRLR